jgi:hypothetical protein
MAARDVARLRSRRADMLPIRLRTAPQWQRQSERQQSRWRKAFASPASRSSPAQPAPLATAMPEGPFLVPDIASPYSTDGVASTAKRPQRDADDLHRVFWRAVGSIAIDVVDKHLRRHDAPSHKAQERGNAARYKLTGRYVSDTWRHAIPDQRARTREPRIGPLESRSGRSQRFPGTNSRGCARAGINPETTKLAAVGNTNPDDWLNRGAQREEDA